MSKLNYKIVRRETVSTAFGPVDRVHVEWRHADGPVKDYVTVPVSHPPAIRYETVVSGEREYIADQVDVAPGTPESIIAMKCEEKRAALAASLGVEP